MHGRPWLPWQRYVADVIGERRPDGRYTYPLVVVTVPRQCGKTTWAMDLALGRCLTTPDYRVAYTAQTGHVTTERFADRFLELADSALAARARMRRSAGTERVTLPARSHLKAFPPKPGALRGSAMDLVIVDEAQEHGTVLGEQLDLTILPTFTTRPRRQLVLVGTAGTDASDYLRRYLAAARDRLPGYAVFEWGATTADDPDDEAVWHATHPGLGRLTDVDALRTARAAMGPAGFAREYLNVWTRTGTRVIDPADWAAVQTGADRPADQRLCFSFEVAADRSAATIAVATTGGWCELVERRPGTEWLHRRCRELQAVHASPFAVDRWGASGPVVDALELAGSDLLIMRTGDVANAAAGLVDAVAARTLAVVPSPALSDAVDGCVQRWLTEGGFVWSLTGASPDALRAVSNALWGARHLPPPPVKPQAYAL